MAMLLILFLIYIEISESYLNIRGIETLPEGNSFAVVKKSSGMKINIKVKTNRKISF